MLLFWMFCTVTGTEADILWALNSRRTRQRQNCRIERGGDRYIRNKERSKKGDRGVILQIYHPCVIDMLMLRQNAEGAPGSSVFLCFSVPFLQSFASVELFIVGSVYVGEGWCVVQGLLISDQSKGTRG